MNELKVPPEVTADGQQILTAWAIEDKQFYVVRPGVYPDPAAWGILLVDLARHIAKTYEDSEGAFRRILEGYAVEIDSPTDEPIGGMTD